MNNTKKHYDSHLADFYSWMAGNFEEKVIDFQKFFEEQNFDLPQGSNVLDLGAGHGIHSVALNRMGHNVTAVDFNQQLLNELSANSDGKIKVVLDDIRELEPFTSLSPELIVCAGDTLTHLGSPEEIEKFINDCARLLPQGGKLLLTFRDYSNALNDDQRFIPVKSSENRILTCILEYSEDKVKVTDLLRERTDAKWIQKVSSYEKVRISPMAVNQIIEAAGMRIIFNEPLNRMQTVIAEKS